jgi:predicted amidohydrolase YtcJ
MTTTVFRAKKIITMNPSLPEATHIAVRDGRILGVGTAESMADLARHQGEMHQDDRFAGRVIMPGMVEGHSHAHEGVLWQYLYLGYYPRKDPRGRVWEGIRDIAAMQRRLREAAARLPADEPIIAWGFDPIFFRGESVDRHALDAAVDDRPVVIVHLSFHAMTVNSAMTERAGLDRHAAIDGILLDDQGRPTGSIKEMAAMHAIHESLGVSLFDLVSKPDTLRRFGEAARLAGVTTATDLFNPLTDEGIASLVSVTSEEGFPIRIVPAMSTLGRPIDEGIERLAACREKNNPRLHFGLAKVMTDGSMTAFTCRLKWPYYHNGMPNGTWNATPEELRRIVQAYHQAGVHLQIHTNGDEAVELMLDTLQEALELWPRLDHRHTLHHCQVADQAQMRRARALGLCMNLLTNHLYYWGDAHADTVLGWERAQRLNPAASVLRHGIPLAIHSDAPVTPLGPLFTAHVACTRKTASGQRLGPHERISVPQALEAITLGAAYTLKLDHLIGSLEMGKYADMAVLDRDPLAGDGEQLAEIEVVATVLGGRVHEG